MKKLATVLALSAPLLASAAGTNLLTNGSFESGLTGWTASNSISSTVAVAVLDYSVVGAAFGATVPADNAVSLSPDAVGTYGVYFVDDNAVQSLSQSFTVAADGDYAVGFSYYVPLNGSLNPGEAAFSVTLGAFSQATVVSALPVATWQAASGNVFLTAGTYTASFAFTTTGGQSKDVVVDRAFVTAVPEPETFALMLAGLAGVGFMARRRQAR